MYLSSLGCRLVPTHEAQPTNASQLSGNRHPRLLGARTLAHPGVEVVQTLIFPNHLHGNLDKDPSEPSGTLTGYAAMVTTFTGLTDSSCQARVRTHLFCIFEAPGLGDLSDDQQRRVQPNPMYVDQGISLRKGPMKPCQLFIPVPQLSLEMAEPVQSLVSYYVSGFAQMNLFQPSNT
jgi:hypothetical protein